MYKRQGLSEEILARSPCELSGGQKRRVAIAGVIAMEPKVLILDEPTAGLDPAGAASILANIDAYRQANQATIIIVSHSMEDVARLTHRLAVVSHGTLPYVGTPREAVSYTHLACLVAVCTDDHFAAGFLCGVSRCGYRGTQSSYQHHQDSQQRQPSWKTFSHMVLSLLSFCSLIVAPFKKMSTKFSVFLETDERPFASPQAKL